MKNVIVGILSLFLVLNSFNISYADKPSITSHAAILIDANTGQVLFEKNAHKSMYPASTTKIMTAILALEKCNLGNKVTIDNETPYGIEGSHIALEPGEIISMEDLLYALLIESANDAAIAIAKHIGGSVENFAKLMNEKAKSIGAKNTHFTNPNGLPDKNHTTTAYDLAMMAKYAMEIDKFREIVKNYNYKIGATNKKSEPRYLKSANRLIYGTGSGNQIYVDGKWVDIKYEGAEGIKTGYTVAAQNCLVASAVRGNQRLISVVLHAQGTNVYVDTHKLLNYGFDNFNYKQLAFKNEFIENIKVTHGDNKYVPGIINQSIFATIPKGREDEIQKVLDIPEELSAPISIGQVLGTVKFTLDGETLATTNIVSTMEVNQKGIYQVVATTKKDSIWTKWWFWLIVLFILWRFYIAYIRYKRRKRRRSKRITYYNTKYNGY
ncbi:D-alanyl-D-alanine carboxypeptidase family protein [Caldisalinibacter kiritimatiensis]|uniref:serine-type D-Ala-D-Ala carboxypeptidase n=1 Tax=Caldisalinibacter kiritimatiensis TaxID=1304284 RepID=R1ARM8_9FIRM|nr:D-alanyl-D-alanine carboxypeptidase family protein [Caldisalinibacter kiritimatiensis]EOC99802.1 D-alanyl-D-alanine carboxypeptidase [Caldisalinibacter kiritimatiensis]